MLINEMTPYKGGVQQVVISSEASVPDSIDFQFSHATINVNFWLVQAIRRNIDMVYNEVTREENEQKIMFIKAVRLAFNLGLKESKDICEWFMNNVNRYTQGKL